MARPVSRMGNGGVIYVVTLLETSFRRSYVDGGGNLPMSRRTAMMPAGSRAEGGDGGFTCEP
uniref:Uncharacterized protein n=1 Tax=Leersia perrieri TaxID=77586 RepID=A0A0D9WTJ6_9ORYZ